MITLPAKPLTAAAFAPFGDVIEATSNQDQRQINEDHTTRFHDLAKVQSVDAEAGLLVNIFRSEARGLPIILHQMERHPKSSQMFMPLGSHPYLVVVAPAGDFDITKIQAFIAGPDQGVNYHAGAWHHYSLALDESSDLLVVDYADIPDNRHLVDLSPAVQITL